MNKNDIEVKAILIKQSNVLLRAAEVTQRENLREALVNEAVELLGFNPMLHCYEFIEKNVKHSNLTIKKSDLYLCFSKWCCINGHVLIPKGVLFEAMTSKGYDEKIRHGYSVYLADVVEEWRGNDETN